MSKNIKLLIFIILTIILFLLNKETVNIEKKNNKLQTNNTISNLKATSSVQEKASNPINHKENSIKNEVDFLNVLNIMAENSNIKIEDKYFIENIISLDKKYEEIFMGKILWQDSSFIYLSKNNNLKNLPNHYKVLFDKVINKVFLLNGFISFNYIEDITYLKNIENISIISVFEKEKLAIAKIYNSEDYFDIFNNFKNDLNLENVKLEYISYINEEK